MIAILRNPVERAFSEATDYAHYDSTQLLSRYVARQGDSASANLNIGGMYCSACVWLLDNALGRHKDDIGTDCVNRSRVRFR